jgi:hypothetical protein
MKYSYITNIEMHFVDYSHIMDLINAWEMKRIQMKSD